MTVVASLWCAKAGARLEIGVTDVYLGVLQVHRLCAVGVTFDSKTRSSKVTQTNMFGQDSLGILGDSKHHVAGLDVAMSDADRMQISCGIHKTGSHLLGKVVLVPELVVTHQLIKGHNTVFHDEGNVRGRVEDLADCDDVVLMIPVVIHYRCFSIDFGQGRWARDVGLFDQLNDIHPLGLNVPRVVDSASFIGTDQKVADSISFAVAAVLDNIVAVGNLKLACKIRRHGRRQIKRFFDGLIGFFHGGRSKEATKDTGGRAYEAGRRRELHCIARDVAVVVFCVVVDVHGGHSDIIKMN